MAGGDSSGPDSFWPNFCKADDDPFPSECGSGSLAEAVLASLGLPFVGTGGGPLKNLDIKHMDAEQVIKLSLLDGAVSNGILKELIVDEDGFIEFNIVGSKNGLAGCEVYHQIQSASYKEECTGVMVTGGKPLPTRKVADWKPIWGDGPKEIYNCFWMAENGLSQKFSEYAVIVFKDPQLVSNYNDGIDNLYEIITPWENIIGYARYIDWPGSDTSPDTTVERSNNSTIPILVSGEEKSSVFEANLGTLHYRKDKTGAGHAGNIEDQWYTEEGVGVEIPIPESFRYSTVRGTEVDMLIAISDILVVGRKIDTVIGIPASDSDALSDSGEAKISIKVNSHSDSVFRLKEGQHYIIVHEEDGTTSVLFADNSRAFDPATFGTGVTAEVDRECAFYSSEHSVLDNVSILPTGGTEGYLVKQIIALVDLQVPCIKVYDPRPEKALEIAEGMDYLLAALISYEPPAPIAFNGASIDMATMEKDHDPTTRQNFSDSPYELALDKMQGGGLSVTLSFLDEAGCVAVSSSLFDYMNAGNGTVTTYVCGPNSTPVLGGYGMDSISVVNDIVYSYADSSSYTVSVSTGPRLLGDLGSISSGATMKTTENVPGTGKVIEDLGNNVHFKVLLDGCGASPMVAINTAPKVIRVGDRVQCTVHNNPVEQ